MVDGLKKILKACLDNKHLLVSKSSLYVLAIFNLMYSVLFFRKCSLESTMVLAAAITTIFAVNALPARYERNTFIIGIIYLSFFF